MSTKREGGKNVAILQHIFKNIQPNTETGWKHKSSPLKTPIIPGIEFFFSIRIDPNSKTIQVLINKSDPRKAISIIKIVLNDELFITKQVFDWTNDIIFDNFSLPVSFDTCRNVLNEYWSCQYILKHYYTVSITCSITWNGFTQDLCYPDTCAHLNIFHNNTEFSDMVIKIKDDEFPAHKNILASHSPVFYKMLTSEMKEAKENSIYLPDTDSDMMKEVLLFFYKGILEKAEKDAEIALKLFKFANMYQIDKLKKSCEYFLIVNLSIDNACEVYFEAKICDSVVLQQHAIAFITGNQMSMINAAAV